MGALSGDPPKAVEGTLNVFPPMGDETTGDQALETPPRGDRVSEHQEPKVSKPSRVETGS